MKKFIKTVFYIFLVTLILAMATSKCRAQIDTCIRVTVRYDTAPCIFFMADTSNGIMGWQGYRTPQLIITKGYQVTRTIYEPGFGTYTAEYKRLDRLYKPFPSVYAFFSGGYPRSGM